MGSSLGPVLVNVIMTELENVIVRKMIDNGLVKFYGRYVDNTLILAKPDYFHASYVSQLAFTVI